MLVLLAVVQDICVTAVLQWHSSSHEAAGAQRRRRQLRGHRRPRQTLHRSGECTARRHRKRTEARTDCSSPAPRGARAHYVGITGWIDGQLRSIAATDPVLLELDDIRNATGEGPALDAIEGNDLVLSGDLAGLSPVAVYGAASRRSHWYPQPAQLPPLPDPPPPRRADAVLAVAARVHRLCRRDRRDLRRLQLPGRSSRVRPPRASFKSARCLPRHPP